MKKKIIVYGAGGHAKSCIEVLESVNKYKILGLIGKKHELNKIVQGYEVIGTDKDLLKFKKKANNFIIGIGSFKLNNLREIVFKKLKSIGFILPKIVASTSYVSKNVQIQEGSIIFHNCFINTGVVIGKNCIINSGTIIEHDSFISHHCNISTSVTINGNVEVGSNSLIGSGSKIIQSIKINKNTLIPMGSIVKENR